MKNNQTALILIALSVFMLLALLLSSCRDKGGEARAQGEDLKAKELLQGIWINEDDQNVAFRVKGDSIFYPDSTSQPVTFQIFRDTFVVHGAHDVKYAILRQTRNLFAFRNADGVEVHLTLSENKDDASLFPEKHAMALNQQQLIKRDTVVTVGDKRFHAYVQVNPTTFKVVRTVVNDDGVAVDNFYYDNIVNLHVYQGSAKLFSRDFRKSAFANDVPADFLAQAVLSDLIFRGADNAGLHFTASLVVPDTMSSYEVMVTIALDGKMSMKVEQ